MLKFNFISLFIIVIMGCRETQPCPDLYCCNTIQPTAEDISVLKMYKSGDTLRFLHNKTDTFLFKVSDTSRYLDNTYTGNFDPEYCRPAEYVNCLSWGLTLNGLNTPVKIELEVNAQINVSNSGFPVSLTEACNQKPNKDSLSGFHAEFSIDIDKNNPNFRVTYNASPDSLLYGSNHILSQVVVLNSTYNFVTYIGESGNYCYYHKDYGIVKFVWLNKHQFELIR